jgi:hypothetical protein
MAYVKIRPRRGSKAEWEHYDTVLAPGELALETPDTGVGTGLTKIKVGDGVTTWKQLPYAIDLSSYTPGGGGGTVTNIGVFVNRNNWTLLNGTYINTITIDGITEDCYPQFTLIPGNGVAPTETEVETFRMIDDLVTGTGVITLRASEQPSHSIVILLKDDAGTGDNVITNYSQIIASISDIEDRIDELEGSIATTINNSLTAINNKLGPISSFYVDSNKKLHVVYDDTETVV